MQWETIEGFGAEKSWGAGRRLTGTPAETYRGWIGNGMVGKDSCARRWRWRDADIPYKVESTDCWDGGDRVEGVTPWVAAPLPGEQEQVLGGGQVVRLGGTKAADPREQQAELARRRVDVRVLELQGRLSCFSPVLSGRAPRPLDSLTNENPGTRTAPLSLPFTQRPHKPQSQDGLTLTVAAF